MTKDELIEHIRALINEESNPWIRLRQSHYYLLVYLNDEDINAAVGTLNTEI